MKLRLVAAFFVATTSFAALDDSLSKLTAVSREGEGNEAASAAWKDVVKSGPEALLPILKASGKGNVVADNWLRLAANTIADEAVTAKKSLPLSDLESFLKDTAQAPQARVLAFDIIQQADKAKADAIEPTLLTDPSQELRRGAVQRLIDSAKAQAEKKEDAGAKETYQKAIDAARDEDQVKTIAEALDKLGVKVDVPKHFGFLMNWQVIGPFDNTKREGFDTVFPPEKEIKLDAGYEGKPEDNGAKRTVKWQAFESKHEQGKLDFNKPLGMLKQTTAYAYTTFNAPEARDAEIRLGCKNGWKVWLNGELLFGRDEYHRGAQMDQYKLKAKLKKGDNAILVKCCQNEQTENWTVEWEFQLRVCDATGTAIAAVESKK
ncbi:hypothetical protein AYO49_04180 [Verrucomicrobiaceae bacterium SCGC AG-212-N21]|nr:hypothetical protein AYO49_04180 [Verrucomicrobiaceae bacterium SCGC AG-212-N21]